MDLHTFCNIVHAVTEGNDAASEFADISPEEFATLGCEPCEDLCEGLREKARCTLYAAAENGQLAQILKQEWLPKDGSQLDFFANPCGCGHGRPKVVEVSSGIATLEQATNAAISNIDAINAS